MSKKLSIELVRSPVACRPSHRRTLQALGLKKIGQTVEHKDVPTIRGMVNKVHYLVRVEENS